MQLRKVLATALGVERVVVTSATVEGDALVFLVRPVKKERRRCSQCGIRCPGDDSGSGVRRWRALDIGRTPVLIAALAPRVKCKTHGVVVEQVPWARPASTR